MFSNLVSTVHSNRLFEKFAEPDMNVELRIRLFDCVFFLMNIFTFQLAVILPLAVAHTMGNLLTNISLGKVAVSFTHTIKAMEPFFTVVLSALFLGEVSNSILFWGSFPLKVLYALFVRNFEDYERTVSVSELKAIRPHFFDFLEFVYMCSSSFS